MILGLEIIGAARNIEHHFGDFFSFSFPLGSHSSPADRGREEMRPNSLRYNRLVSHVEDVKFFALRSSDNNNNNSALQMPF